MKTENKKLAFNIKVEPLHFGYLVHIGGSTYNVDTLEELLTKTKNYYDNPESIETIWGDASSRKLRN